jgi:lactoylglutathione lyase
MLRTTRYGKVAPELNLLVLRAADMAALVQFYAALGIEFNKEQHGSGPEHYSGKAGGALLEIYPIGSGAATTAARLGFTVSSISTSITAAVAAGGTIVSPPQDSSWGCRAVLTDPEGHKVELLQKGGV